jgi:hypothetical protein
MKSLKAAVRIAQLLPHNASHLHVRQNTETGHSQLVKILQECDFAGAPYVYMLHRFVDFLCTGLYFGAIVAKEKREKSTL